MQMMTRAAVLGSILGLGAAVPTNAFAACTATSFTLVDNQSIQLCSAKFTARDVMQGLGTTMAATYDCSTSFPGNPLLCSPNYNAWTFAQKDWDNFMYTPPSLPSKLLVFFPGGGTPPADYSDFMLEAAAQGYRVIGLSYENVRKPDECKQEPGAPSGTERPIAAQDTCYTDIMGEKAFGYYGGTSETGSNYDSDNTKFETDNGWNYGNGAVERLSAALAYLNATHPQDGWGQFLGNCQIYWEYTGFNVGGTMKCPNWSKISLAAHSQGTKVAAEIAQAHDLGTGRVLMFSGEPDVLDETDTSGHTIYQVSDPSKPVPESPSYLVPDGATPPSHYFCFDLVSSFTSPNSKL